MHTIESVAKALEKAAKGKSKCCEACLEHNCHHGQTGPGTRRILNNLLGTNEETYLEIGLYHGSSFAAALNGNKVKCAYGIDMLHPGYEREMRADILANIKKFHPKTNGRVIIHFEDAFKFEIERINEPVTVYFYDADHTPDGHKRGITHFWNAMADRFVMAIDDWNLEEVRDGTWAALNEVHAAKFSNHTLDDRLEYYQGFTFGLVEK